MKKSKKNGIAIVLVVLLLALAVGYAAFSQALPINGTAKTQTGNWDVKFKSAEASKSVVTAATTNNTATVGTDGKSVTVSVDLAAPGDGSNITTVIENAGKIDAKLTGFEVTGDFTATSTDNVYEYGAMKLTVPAMNEDGSDVIKAGASKTFVFSVEWDENINATEVQAATFTITFTYEQDNVKFTSNPSWTPNN